MLLLVSVCILKEVIAAHSITTCSLPMHERTLYEEFAKLHAPHGQIWILDCGLCAQAKQHLEDGEVKEKDYSSQTRFISSSMEYVGLGGDADILKNALELIWQPDLIYNNTKRFGCTYRTKSDGTNNQITVGCIFSKISEEAIQKEVKATMLLEGEDQTGLTLQKQIAGTEKSQVQLANEGHLCSEQTTDEEEMQGMCSNTVSQGQVDSSNIAADEECVCEQADEVVETPMEITVQE